LPPKPLANAPVHTKSGRPVILRHCSKVAGERFRLPINCSSPMEDLEQEAGALGA
jgi:hypothetical protein